MAFDPSLGVTVLFGGLSSGYRDDTWEYDGTGWSAGPAAPAGLSARAGHAMAHDSVRDVTVLFGGTDGALLEDTWEYDGGGWSQGPAAPAGLTARKEHAMAFDVARGVTVLTGGSASAPLNDVWEYDGSAWSSGIALPTGGREGASLAYDPNSGRVVLFGGWDRVLSSRATLEYDGTTWTTTSPLSEIEARHDAGMAYHAGTGALVVFGGWEGQPDARQGNSSWLYRSCPTLAISPPALPDGQVGVAYSQTMTASGGTAPYQFFAIGALPTGLTLSSAGVISGTPTVTESSTFLLVAEDVEGCQVRQSYTITICGVFITTTTLPRATVGTPYDAQLSASGGVQGYMWSVIAGSLPPGVLLDVMGGRLQGTPTAAGTFPFTVEVVDALGCSATAQLQIDVCTPLSIGPPTLPPGTVGQAYAVTLTATGGTAPYLFSSSVGLPPGLTLASNGLISGTPTSAGTSTFLVNATDTLGCSTTRSYLFEILERVDYLAGAGLAQPNPNRVRAFDPSGAPTLLDILPYGAGSWGATAASGDVNGGSDDEVLTGPGPGATLGPQIRGFRRDSTPISKINFFAYGTLQYGANVDAGKTDADPYAEILSGAGPGDVFGPHVRGFNFDASVLSAIAKINFFAYSTLKYGVNVSSGDTDGDAFAELVTGPGPGVVFAPIVKGFNVDGGAVTSIAKINFSAFSEPRYGANVASGDVDGDPYDEIAAAPGPGPDVALFPGRFRGFGVDGGVAVPLAGFDTVGFPATAYGGRVGLGDLTGDGAGDLVGGAGPDPAATSQVRAWSYISGALVPTGVSLYAFPGTSYGVNVGTGHHGY